MLGGELAFEDYIFGLNQPSAETNVSGDDASIPPLVA